MSQRASSIDPVSFVARQSRREVGIPDPTTLWDQPGILEPPGELSTILPVAVLSGWISLMGIIFLTAEPIVDKTPLA